MTRLLVVTPAPEFANSLRFALEADGYEVTALAHSREADGLVADFDCTVLDHHGLDGDKEAQHFVRRFAPVVLLANSAQHPMAPESFVTLTKPSLGPMLSQAVRLAIETRRPLNRTSAA
jgi:CheY-like chemotaxis protein